MRDKYIRTSFMAFDTNNVAEKVRHAKMAKYVFITIRRRRTDFNKTT